ncbi:MAG: tetratricopeptide repeat protein [Proteobacteria bacterium]|nr:tetratricopeptide repeat protein [Pseudomonadota bacterium]
MFKFLTFFILLALGACAAGNPELNGFEEKANQGDAKAAFSLGHAYFWGQGVAKDHAKAAKWWQVAAQRDDAQAMANLGDMYANGLGVTKNIQRSAEWYKRGANGGNSIAQFRLGSGYAKGIGVPRDDVSAYMWLILALDGNLSDADRRHAFRDRDRVITELTPQQRLESERRAREWRTGRQ